MCEFCDSLGPAKPVDPIQVRVTEIRRLTYKLESARKDVAHYGSLLLQAREELRKRLRAKVDG